MAKYLDETGLNYLVEKIKADISSSDIGGTVDLTNYYTKQEVDVLLDNISTAQGKDGVGIQSIQLVNYELIITLTDNTIHNLGNVRGQQGDKGEQGIQGIQGEKGIKGNDGINGKDGINGTNGINGQDGYSPIATVTPTDTGATITITDKNGTTTADILNGKDGTGGGSGGGSSNNYSTTEEQQIGTWIDGKPIYRKTWVLPVLEYNNSGKYKQLPAVYFKADNSAYIKDLIRCDTVYNYRNSSFNVGSANITGINWYANNSFTDFRDFSITSSSGVYISNSNFKLWYGNDFSNFTPVITLEYTKI